MTRRFWRRSILIEGETSRSVLITLVSGDGVRPGDQSFPPRVNPCNTTQHISLIKTNVQAYTHTHTHTFNGPFFGTTRVSRYQKGKTNLDFTEARDSEWQWHQLGHMLQVCTLLQTDNHTNTSPLSFYRPDALPAAQPTASKH